MGEHTDKPLLTDRFTEAIGYALDHHRGEPRKGSGIPYASHLFAVTAIVLEMGNASEDEAIAALLHDVIEDDGGPRAEAEIRARWGNDVADWVVANSDSLSGSAEKEDWRIRKQRYIEAIAGKPIEAVRVSIADKLHNARMIAADFRIVGEKLWKRFKADGPQILWYYRSLVGAFEQRRDELGVGGAVALSYLREAVDEIEAIVETAEAGVIDLGPRLDPEARELFERHFPDGISTEPGENSAPRLDLWQFGYVCMFELGRIPDAVDEEMRRWGCDDNKPLVYLRNLREGRAGQDPGQA